MTNTIRVINNRDRYFNWARQGQVIEVDSQNVDYYLQNGFSLADYREVKNNIVNPATPPVDEKTKAQLMEKLDHYWIKYNKKANKTELEKLISDHLKTLKVETPEGEQTKVEKMRKILIENALFTQEEVNKMSDEEITKAYEENGF